MRERDRHTERERERERERESERKGYTMIVCLPKMIIATLG